MVIFCDKTSVIFIYLNKQSYFALVDKIRTSLGQLFFKLTFNGFWVFYILN